MQWAIGLTTCPQRRWDLLPRTLSSLARAGFEKPRLFVDGCGESMLGLGCEITFRSPKIHPWGNWLLGLMELWVRDPRADRWMMCQDDFVTSRNLRQYLEAVPFPSKSYLNLYTFAENQKLAPRDLRTNQQRVGFFESNQLGRGAVALVFNREGVIELLTHHHVIERKTASEDWRGEKAIDGGVVQALSLSAGPKFKEMVHGPTLVQHVGIDSTIGNARYPEALGFRGEDFDAMEFLKENPQATSALGGFGFRRFIGRWQVMDGNRTSSFLRITEDLSAIREHAPDPPGRVEVSADDREARITHVDGHRDVLIFRSEGLADFLGLGREAASFDHPPKLKMRAIKLR